MHRWFCESATVLVLAGCSLSNETAPLDETAAPTTASAAPAPTTAAAPRTSSRPARPQRPRYPGCHTAGDPRAGVNTPIRLVIRSPCIRVRGIAGCIWVDKGDGDTHIALLLSARDAAKYLTPGNRSWTCDSDQGSDTAPRLVVEVIPQHCRIRRDNCADRGHFTDPAIPRNGQHVTVTGPWVQDTSRYKGRTLWSEIHPAWRITFDEDDPGVPVQHGGDFPREDAD
jgi:hypothetical protein